MCACYLGLVDGYLNPSYSLVLPVQLDLGDPAELGQNCGQVVLQIYHMTDAMSWTHQQCCS